MAKLTATQIEKMISGLKTICIDLKSTGVTTLRLHLVRDDPIGVTYLSGQSDNMNHERKFTELFGFTHVSLSCTDYKRGLTTLQAKVAGLFQGQTGISISTKDWLKRAEKVRLKLESKLAERIQQTN